MTEPAATAPHRDAPRHDAPVDQPGSRRVGNLSAALRRAEAIGPLTRGELGAIVGALLVVALVFLVPVQLPWLIQLALAVVLGTIIGTEIGKRAIPRRVRRALEAFGYLGEWELERGKAFQASMITSPEDARRWLAAFPEMPEDRWLRWELLLLADEPAEAAEVAARIPDDTPYDRFERAYAMDRVAWSQGGTSDLASLRGLAEAVGPPDDDDRRHAEVALAVALGKEAAADGRDAVAPLAAARDLLPAEVGLGKQFVLGLRLLAGVAAVVGSLVLPAIGTFLLALGGAAG
jgi:hypothetical protein